MMVSPRRLSLTTGTAIVGIALICATLGSGPGVSTDARRHAREAAAQMDSLAASHPDSVRALALAYVERARLGLGSPFRLVDEAVRDPRLDDSTGKVVAWAILDRVFDRSIDEIDASVLDPIGPPGAGAGHLALITRVINSSRDPRIGETTIRLAYGLASAQGTVSASAMPAVVDVAALVRDRALAEADLRRAIERADASRIDLIDELRQQRATRELDVERPLLQALSPDAQDDAIARVPEVLREIALIEPDSSAVTLTGRSLLPISDVPIVARLGARRPPTGATAVILQSRAALLQSDSTLAPSIRRSLSAATNEETLVAAYALADHFSESRSAALSRVMVSEAVSLRTLAQQPVWFAGDQGPSAGQIVGQFGLRRIDFDRDVPTAWRPFYVQMIASALGDLGLVFPSYEPTGLTIHFQLNGLPDSALAMHDPRTHTLLLPVATAAGTIAHELAHDLDWQSARRLFARGGGYASDRSFRENGGPLGSSIRGLAAARATSGNRGVAPESGRPAEVFARGADWFIADALAQMGRSNGYLSGIEDQLIPGYTTTAGDAASLSIASALVDGLAEMTVIPDSIEASYLDRWQSADRLDAAAVMARLRAAPVLMRRPVRPTFGISPATMAQLESSASCTLDRLRRGSARDRLMALAIDAKATGILSRRAHAMSPESRPAWAHALLGEPAWNPTASTDVRRRMSVAVLDGVARAGLVAFPPAPFNPVC